MIELKILNLYACLGGNRYKWDEITGLNCKVTAVERDPHLAQMYKLRFPNDTVIGGDAKAYLLENYDKFDFIFASPPCPTHSRARFWGSKGRGKTRPAYADLGLYEQIIFLENYFDGFYCVENVVPYYKPLIVAQERNRHLYWCNFNLPKVITKRAAKVGTGKDEINRLCEFHDIKKDFLMSYKGSQRIDKIIRNLVDYEAGKTILSTAYNLHKANAAEQKTLFQ